jgi:hypothetical protein
MQIISLNIWGGKMHDPLINFIEKNKNNTDIFTFQEVTKYEKNVKFNGYYSNILGEIIHLLPNYNYYFAPRSKGNGPNGKIDFPMEFGQATFIKKEINKCDEREIFVYKNFNLANKYFDNGHFDFPSLILQSIIEIDGKKIMILNFHGLWTPTAKIDTEHRLRQSQIIIDHIEYMNLPTIIAGDFNLRIDTQSLKMFEDAGMRNLIKESGVLTTRSTLYDKKWRSIDRYADYILTTKNINISNFKVMRAKISDHLPLFLRFEI